MFPIAATISKNDNVDIYLLSYAIMLGASSVFMSSFGYQVGVAGRLCFKRVAVCPESWTAQTWECPAFVRRSAGTLAGTSWRPRGADQSHDTAILPGRDLMPPFCFCFPLADQPDGPCGGRPLEPRLPQVWHPHAAGVGEACGLQGGGRGAAGAQGLGSGARVRGREAWVICVPV